MSNADAAQLAIAAETTFGVSPTGNYQILRYTSHSLTRPTETERSTEIEPTGQVTGTVRTNISAQGAINFLWSYGAQDILLPPAFRSAGFSSEVTLLSTTANEALDITAATGTLAATGIHTNAVVGQWVRIKNLTAGGTVMLNRAYKILTVGTDEITVAGITALTDHTQAASASDNAVVVMGAQIVNGTTLTHFTTETDKGAELTALRYSTHTGLTPNGLNLHVGAQNIIDGSFDMMGKSGTIGNSATAGGYDAAPTESLMNGIDNSVGIMLKTPVVNADNSFKCFDWTFQTNSGLRPRNNIGALGADSIGWGKFVAEGRVQSYFTDAALMSEYLDFNLGAVTQVFLDESNNMYVLENPRVRWTTDSDEVSGEESDIIEDIGWRAEKHPTELITTRLVRFPV